MGEGINAATRELSIDRTEAQRGVKIDRLTDEAKAVATREPAGALGIFYTLTCIMREGWQT